MQPHQTLASTKLYCLITKAHANNLLSMVISILEAAQQFNILIQVHPLTMDHCTAISVASALVSSRFDYANSVLFGCPRKHIACLQRAQHALPSKLRTLRSTPQLFHLVLVLFVSQLPKYGIPYRLTFSSFKHSLHLDVI